MAMENTLQTGEEDCISNLPEGVLVHIISFLPTELAAQTSLVSRRFRRLWESSPSLTLDNYFFSLGRSDPSCFVSLANRIVLNRDPPSPILSLYLRYGENSNFHLELEGSYIASLLDKASALGLKHLTIGLDRKTCQTVWPCIVSLSSLESLSLDSLPYVFDIPSTSINLKHLKSLCIRPGCFARADYINQLVPQLDALEYFEIRSSFFGTYYYKNLNIKSLTLRKLTLELFCPELRISAPSLEFFDFKTYIGKTTQWDWEMPMLTKAIIHLHRVYKKNVEDISKMLNIFTYVEELHLTVHGTSWRPDDIFHALLVPSVDPPTFIRMKHFHLETCFHRFNIQDLVAIIQHSPALESLKLVHKVPFSGTRETLKLWKSMLPRNAEGNRIHAFYEDLHIKEKKADLLKKLLKKRSSKRLKT